MPLVPRVFDPSKRVEKEGRKPKRTEHIMLSGGREGPEVVDESLRAAKGLPPKTRTARYAPDGSKLWTQKLEDGETPEDTRTQSKFLRKVRPQLLAYSRGIMSVSALWDGAKTALLEDPRGPQVELTVVTGDGRLVAVTGRLVDADVDTLVNTDAASWVSSLSKLAEGLQAAQLNDGAVPRGVDRASYVPRVYLGYKGQAIPVEQFAVGSASTQAGGIQRVTVTGVYLPAPGDPIVMAGKGEKTPLAPGTRVTLPAAALEYVSVDPPEYRQEKYVDSLAFARSRGLIIEPDANPFRLPAGQPVTFPFSLVLRLRTIYPPAPDYYRLASTPVETVESVDRDLRVAAKHIEALTEEVAALNRAGRYTRKRKKEFQFVDPLTRLPFSLRDEGSQESIMHPVLVWSPVAVGEKTVTDAEIVRQTAIAEFAGRPVTPMDFLRVLRALNLLDALRKLRARYRNRERP
jgi:hypothetical protein